MRYQIGDQPIPGYKLEAFLGAGSYGEVWRAGGPGGVPCALKFISMDSKSGLKEFRSIRMVKKLQHPNLCPVQAIWLRDPDGNVLSDSGEDSISIRLMGPKELVIAMGLGQKSLAQRLEEMRSKGGIPVRDLLRYMIDAAKGIDYLNSPEHELEAGSAAAIIHCDIKPANLLIVGGGVQVCDYGVAKALAPDSKKTFAAGTPAYAPPELINNEPCPQTDQYSLAVTYYEMRTGRLPFDEARAIVANLMGQLDFSGVGPDEREVLRQATHKQPGKRFESCEEFVEALKLAANITLGPSGVVATSQTRRAVPAPPPAEAPRARPVVPPPAPASTPAAAKSLSDLLQPGGELVPDHFLTKLLGRGGYGEVWEARASGGVRCALKVVRDLQGRGRQEFEVLDTISKLDHPCLVQLRGYWLLAPNGTRVPANQVGLAGVPDPSIVVISTDLAEKNLLDRLKECKQDGLPGIPPDELVGHVRQAAVALDYLNVKHHIQHRDVKPENLLLRGDRLLVSDFGLAKLVEGDGGAVQSSSSGMTLEYAAPELLQKKVSSRTDQYSLALTYYTLRTGRMPFPSGMGQFDTMQARIKGQLDLSSVSAAEQAVLRKALAPNPADRFASCEELARQLAHASGVGTGPIPSLSLRGPDLSRITPADLAPRMTPPARSGPPAVAKATPNYPQDTPRASSRPGEVPLTPAEAGGTIMFGDQLPAGPAPSSPRATPAPWVADAAPVRETRSGRRGPQWNQDAAAEGGGGRTVAVIGGVAVLLALAAAGVYFSGILDKTRTVASSTGRTTVTTGKSEDNGGGVVQDQKKEKVDALKGDVRRLIAERNFDAAWEKVGELKALDETEASRLAIEVKRAEEAVPRPLPKDDRVTKAAENFGPGQRKIQAGLDQLGQVPEASPDYPRAQSLRASWERAKTAAAYQAIDAATLLKFRDEYADLRPPAGNDRLTDDDRGDLQTFYRELLANNVRTAVPGLTDKWAEVAAVCEEAARAKHPDATTRAWVAACRLECRAEQDLPRDDSDATPADPALGGYAKYAAALRAWQDGTDTPKGLETAAATAVGLVPSMPAKAGNWASPHRFGRLADLLWAAREPLRTSDDKDLEHPYTEPGAGKAIDWLTAAARAAEMAKRPAADRARFDYELLLAKWSQGKPAGDELARLIDAKYPNALDPAPRARFGVILAAARPADATRGYRAVFDALRAGGGRNLRSFAAGTVLKRLATDTGIDRQAGGTELLSAAGRELFHNRRAWADAGLAEAPASVAAGLFDRAAVVTKRPDDFAWAGICRSEVPGISFVKLTGDLDAARDSGSGPAALVLEGLVAAREPWRKPGAWPDRAAEVNALRRAGDLFRKASAACRADKTTDRTDELLLLSDRAAAVTARLADEVTDPKAKDVLLKHLDGLASDLKAAVPGRLEGLGYEARALEGRAPALPPEQRFTPTGAYARADQKYAWSGGLWGAPPGIAVGRGRNLLKWTEDEYRAGGGTFLDRERLDRAESHLRAVTGRKDVTPGDLAEAHYQLGEATLLRYEAEPSGAGKSKLFGEAVASFQAAVEAADRLDEDPWTEAVLRATYGAAAAQRGRQAENQLRPIEAETTAKFLDGLADRKSPRAPTPVWRAALKVRAVRLREAIPPKEGDWFQKVRDAAEEAVAAGRGRDREADLRAELLVTLAEGCSARLEHRKHYDLEKAAGYAREAMKLTEARADLPTGLRTDARGALGMILYADGVKTPARIPEVWPDARESLAVAVRHDQGRPDAWKWRFALGALMSYYAPKEATDNAAANLGAEACRLQMPVFFRLSELKDAASLGPDDRKLAEDFLYNSRDMFKASEKSCARGVKGAAADAHRPTWELAAAELAYILAEPDKRAMPSEKLGAAIRVAEDKLDLLPDKSVREQVEEQLRRVKNYPGVKVP